MDPHANSNPDSMFFLDSNPDSYSSVTKVVLPVPAMVEGINLAKKKRGRPRKNSDKGKLIEDSRKSTKTLLGNMRGDMFISLGGGDSFDGGDFMRHTIKINTGEDIIKRIMSFKQNSSRGKIVLSARGVVANVKIRQLDSNCNVLKFKDAYKIISLSRTIVATEDGGVRNETREWQIMIGGADKYVFGGFLVGELTAASPVYIEIGSFQPLNTNLPHERNDMSKAEVGPSTMPDEMASSSTEEVQRILGFKRPDIDLNQQPLDFES